MLRFKERERKRAHNVVAQVMVTRGWRLITRVEDKAIEIAKPKNTPGTYNTLSAIVNPVVNKMEDAGRNETNIAPIEKHIDIDIGSGGRGSCKESAFREKEEEAGETLRLVAH